MKRMTILLLLLLGVQVVVVVSLAYPSHLSVYEKSFDNDHYVACERCALNAAAGTHSYPCLASCVTILFLTALAASYYLFAEALQGSLVRVRPGQGGG